MPRYSRSSSAASQAPTSPFQATGVAKKGLVGTRTQKGGNPRSADHGGSTPVPPRSSDSHSGGSVLSFCGSCEVAVGQQGIGCDKCDNWFHPSPLCMGVSERVIDVILEAGGDGVEYGCTQCRSRPAVSGASRASTTPGDPAVAQLFLMVKSLCAAVAKLTEKVDTVASIPNVTPSFQTQGTSGDDLRMSIREEIIEMEERRKRRESVIFRGILVDSNDDARSSMDNITRFLLNVSPPMTDLYCIDRTKGLYRVKVTDDDARRKLVMEAKNLRNNIAFKGIYINRDLTYKQRKELYERRQRNRQAGVSASSDHRPAASSAGGASAQPGPQLSAASGGAYALPGPPVAGPAGAAALPGLPVAGPAGAVAQPVLPPGTTSVSPPTPSAPLHN